jgi:hypothetical protein
MATNTQRTIVYTVEVEADDHDTGPLSDVMGFVRDDIVNRVADDVSHTVKDSLTQKIKKALDRHLSVDDLTNRVEQALIDNISSEGWSILSTDYEVKE